MMYYTENNSKVKKAAEEYVETKGATIRTAACRLGVSENRLAYLFLEAIKAQIIDITLGTKLANKHVAEYELVNGLPKSSLRELYLTALKKAKAATEVA